MLKFTSLALLSGNIFDPRNDSGGMAFWISLLLGNITTLILSANGHKQLVSGLERFPAEVRSAALDNLIVDDGATSSLGILFVFTTDLVLIKTTKLERGCLLCDVMEYGPSMMRLVVSLLRRFLFVGDEVATHNSLSPLTVKSKGTESINQGVQTVFFPDRGKTRFARRHSLRELSRGIPDRRRCADSRRLDAFTKHWLRCGGAVGEPLSEPHVNIYWRTTIRELVFRALCGFVVSWLYSIPVCPCTNPDRPLID